MAQLEGVAAELATPTQFGGGHCTALQLRQAQSQNPGSGRREIHSGPGAVTDIRDVLAEQQRASRRDAVRQGLSKEPSLQKIKIEVCRKHGVVWQELSSKKMLL